MSRSHLHRSALSLALAMLAACAPSSTTRPAERPPVRADLVRVAEARTDDPSLLVVQYREWDAEGQLLAPIELDHGHGPAEEDTEEDETVVQARIESGGIVPIQAVDTDGAHVIVDLDALPMGRQTLRLVVVHDGLTSDELAIPILDQRPAAP